VKIIRLFHRDFVRRLEVQNTAHIEFDLFEWFDVNWRLGTRDGNTWI
jgi:hypothetical protein